MKAVAIISDLHVGSQSGLCSPAGIAVGEGGKHYYPDRFQLSVWNDAWLPFWRWIYKRIEKAEHKVLVINGEAVEGVHHNIVDLATHNINYQETAAIKILEPVAAIFDETYYVRGSEAHTLPGSQSEERVARGIGSVPLDDDQFTRWQLWLDVDGVIFNIAHHIGVTSSTAYESSAPMRELVAAMVEAGQWGQQMPDVIVRSHRHRYVKVTIPSMRGEIQAIITPGWQLRTPHVERIDRLRVPHIGGILFQVEDGQCSMFPKIYPMMPNHLVKV